MMPKLPSRAALLVPVLSLGLFVPGFNPNPTRADTLPTPCELVASAPTLDADDNVLLLSAIVSADVDPVLAAAPPLPVPVAPPPPGTGVSPGRAGAPKPLGTDLRPPDPSLLNREPIVAARQLRESLSEKQKADLQAVLTKHRGTLQQVRGRLPGLPAEARGNRPVRADQETMPSQVSTDVQRISAQINQDIEPLLTPKQRALLQKARPKRPRAELPETPATRAVAGQLGC